MREIIVKLYKFNELPTDDAKEKARQWWRDCETQTFGGDPFTLDPVTTVAPLLGIEFRQTPVKLMSGRVRYDPVIRWSGFSSQGDGASFEGSYQYVEDSEKKVRAEFGTDEKLHAITDGLAELQRTHGHKITATITQRGRYVHKYTMDAEVMIGDEEADAELTKAVLELMRDFAQWIYDYLEAEYDYRMSDENIDDAMEANEYEFTEDGTRSDG